MNHVFYIIAGPNGTPMVVSYIEYKSSMAYRGTPARPKSKSGGKPRLFKGWRA